MWNFFGFDFLFSILILVFSILILVFFPIKSTMADFLTRWDTELELLDSDKKQLLDEIVKKFEEDPTNVDFCCRQIKACLVVADSYEKIKSKYDAKKYTEEALKHAKMGLILNSDSMEVHKWFVCLFELKKLCSH